MRWIAPLLLCLTVGPGLAEEVEVDIELVLAVDVSRSMSPHELDIQRRGYAAALASEEVARAIARGALGRIAVIYVEWAGAGTQRIVTGWTLLESRADAEAFAARLLTHDAGTLRRTSIAGALDFSAGLFEANGHDGLRKVIDVSGDGPNNDGRPVTEARDAALARGIVINGLPLMTQDGAGADWTLPDLDAYYRACVTGGPASFVLPVLDWDQFPEAVRRKLVMEIAGGLPGHGPDPVPGDAGPERLIPAAGEAAYDCLIGEKIWEQRRRLWEQQ